MKKSYHIREGQRSPTGKQPFVDWRYVQAGRIYWLAEGTGANTLYTTSPPGNGDHMPHGYRFIPSGVRIRSLQAEKRPVELISEPWESYGIGTAGYNTNNFHTIIDDAGKYRAWYSALTKEQVENAHKRSPNYYSHICYAESEDGIEWKKPAFDIKQYNGKKTNIVFGGEFCPDVGVHGWTVFKDPAAVPEERYKMIFAGRVSEEKLAKYKDEFLARDKEGIFAHKLKTGSTGSGVYGAVSPDGISWKLIAKPLLIHHSDTLSVVYYDQLIDTYVGYFRMNYNDRRYVGRAETDNFREWPYPTPVLGPGAGQTPYTDYYLNCRTSYPGSPDVHLMFPSLYDRFNDISEIHLAASVDGILWDFVPGGAVIPSGTPGAWDGAYKCATINLLRLKDYSLALPFVGAARPHKYYRKESSGGKNALAVWPGGRLSCIEAEEYGEFTTVKMVCPGRHLYLNLQTKQAGFVKVAVLDAQGQPLPGRSFEEADPLVGDHYEKQVSWRGKSELGFQEGEAVMLQFKMRSAQIFAFEIK